MVAASPAGTVAGGAVLVALGLLVRRRAVLRAVAGPRTDLLAERAGLADMVGLYAVLVGALTVVLGVVQSTVGVPAGLWDAVGLGILAAAAVVVYGIERLAAGSPA